MAEEFIDDLPKIPTSELSEDMSCMICFRKYGTDSADVAVRLPCNHHVGLECISTWLSPNEIDCKNTCPMCRHVFFDAMDEAFDVIEGTEQERYEREIVRRVGQPPQEGQAPSDLTSWYGYFVEAAAEQYEESLTQARTFLVRRFRGRDDVEREENFRSSQARSPAEFDYRIANQATTFRTLAIRDVLLYLEFVRNGNFPPLSEPVRPLNEEQMEALFQELRRRGAFEPDLHPFPHYEGLADREMWLLHREEGESYTTSEGGFWGLMLG